MPNEPAKNRRTRRETCHLATRVEPAQLAAIDAAAAEAGLPRGTWVRLVLLAAAGVSPLRDQMSRGARLARAEGRYVAGAAAAEVSS